MNENMDKLIWSYLDGDANRDQVEQLEAILRDDADARAEFVRAASLDHELTRVCGVGLSEESPSGDEALSVEWTQPARRPLPDISIANGFSHSVRIAAAATLVLSLGLLAVVYVRNLSQSAVQGIAAIESREGSVFCRAPGTESARRVEAGESLADGSELVTRENGTVGLLFRDRSAVRLEPGSAVAIAEVGKTIEVRQTRGALTASVTRQTRTDAYLFSTPHAEVRIHGTKFRMSTDDKTTEVAVSEGEVAVTGRKDRETARVAAGQSCLVVEGIVSPPRVGDGSGVGGKPGETLDPRFGGVFFKKYADIYDSEKKFALDVLNPEIGLVLHRLDAGMAEELRASSSNTAAEVVGWSELVNGEDSVGVYIGNMTKTWWSGQIPLPAIAADAYTVEFRHIFRKSLRENGFVFGFHCTSMSRALPGVDCTMKPRTDPGSRHRLDHRRDRSIWAHGTVTGWTCCVWPDARRQGYSRIPSCTGGPRGESGMAGRRVARVLFRGQGTRRRDRGHDRSKVGGETGEPLTRKPL